MENLWLEGAEGLLCYVYVSVPRLECSSLRNRVGAVSRDTVNPVSLEPTHSAWNMVGTVG